MTMHTDPAAATPMHNPTLDPSLRALENALDSLGAADRAGAPPTLEQNILRVSRNALKGGAVAHSDTPSLFSPMFRAMSHARLAAAIILIAVVGATSFIVVRSRAATARQFARAEADLDTYLASADTSADATDTTLVLGNASLVDLKASIAETELALDDFWAVPDEESDPLGSDLESTL